MRPQAKAHIYAELAELREMLKHVRILVREVPDPVLTRAGRAIRDLSMWVARYDARRAASADKKAAALAEKGRAT